MLSEELKYHLTSNNYYDKLLLQTKVTYSAVAESAQYRDIN